MKEKLDLLVKNAEEKAKEIKSEADYLNIKSLFLGKKSELSEYMAGIKDMSLEEKKSPFIFLASRTHNTQKK